jgi:hypothetical protein
MFLRDNPTQQQALGFLIAQTTYIEPQVYRLKYPELNYAELIPVDSSANEWAKSITFFSIDFIGAAQWFNAAASDIPLADIARAKMEAGIEMAAVGYRYNLEELGQAMMLPNTNLTVERAAAARRAYEEFVHNASMYGDSRKNWLGLTTTTLVSVLTATNTWAFRVAQSPSQAPQILQDVNGLLTNIWQSSLTVEMADTLLLPLSALTLLASQQLPNTTMTLLQFIQANNLYTLETGRALTIRAVRGLDSAGASGNGRCIAYSKDPECIKLHIPMPHRFYPVWQRGPFVFDVPGIFRMAGLEIRRPGSMRFLDGVC